MKYYTIIHKISDQKRLDRIKIEISELFDCYFILSDEITIVKTKYDHSQIQHTFGQLIHSPDDQLLVSESIEETFSGWTTFEFEEWFRLSRKRK